MTFLFKHLHLTSVTWNLRQQWQCAGLIGTIVFKLTMKFVIYWHYFVSVTNVAFWDPSHGKRLLARKCVKISIFAWTKTLHLAENWIFICSRRLHNDMGQSIFLLLLRFSPLWCVLGFDFMFVLGFSSVADICSCCSIFENNLPPWWICVDLSEFPHCCYLNQYHMFKFLLLCLHSFYGFRILGFIIIKNK